MTVHGRVPTMVRSIIFSCIAFAMAFSFTEIIVGPNGIIATKKLDSYIEQLEDSLSYHRWVNQELKMYQQDLAQRTTLEDNYDGEFLFPQPPKNPLEFQENSPLAGKLTPPFTSEVTTMQRVLPFIIGICFGTLAFLIFKRKETVEEKEEVFES